MISQPEALAPQTSALITGGGGDLARAIREELTSCKISVHAPARAQLDVTSTASIEDGIKGLNRLDLLVSNAGLLIDRSMTAMSPLDFSAVLEANLSGAFRVARAALKIMSRQRSGHIIFIGSYSALSGPAGQCNYAAAKAGLIALTQSLAREYGARGIRVNCVLPGFLETKMTAHLGDELRAQFRDRHALGRFNTITEAARFIRFLHQEMPHTSGQVFSLDSRPHRWT
ncbi:MAG: SDR family oxidoreductase [Verrucomicrobia bacterium]|nr:SDR family oxidoreductase [Verrucomicrobiota bacterium]